MKLDIRKRINNSFLYKRFAYYQSEGFIELMKFLERENILDDFCKECHFRQLMANALERYKDRITLWGYFQSTYYSFEFAESRKGFDFWYKKIFENEKFKKIENKLLCG